MALTDTLNRIPTLIKWAVGIGLAIILLVAFFQFGGSLSNRIGNWIFSRQINAKQAEVQKQLDEAAEQKKALEQTLLDLKEAKEDLAEATKQRELAERIFSDQSKNSAEKVAEYKKALAATPTRTDTTNITVSDLCKRAMEANSRPELIAALCQ
jgi:chromosome segregation ATPase